MVSEGTELRRGLDIATEENEASRLDASDEISIGFVDFVSGDTEEQKLTMGGAFHSVQTTRSAIT